jgi:Zn-dependent peptidase ImmA (M78 family)
MNTTEFGNAFEQQVHDYLKSAIEQDQFYLKKEHCRLFWKKGYYSQQRRDKIIFDVAIEVWRPGAETYSFLLLIECKRYMTRNVPVGDIEQFFQKVQQVAPANSKAILASNAGFDTGTRHFAESNGVALLRFASPSEIKWQLERPPSLGATRADKEERECVDAALSLFHFTHLAMDLYARNGNVRTNSFWDFVQSLIETSNLSEIEICRLENPKGRPKNAVAYISNLDLEDKATLILKKIGHTSGPVSLQDICALETRQSGLIVEMGVLQPKDINRAPPLGKISFSPPVITVFEQTEENDGRERFTLAHELGHLLLGHSRFIAGEFSDDEDYSLNTPVGLLGPEIARLEYQANFFATCLLMPSRQFAAEFIRITKQHDIKNKGFGMLFVDNQACNQQGYYIVTSYLMKAFGVSRAAATMRLQTLGLLKDARSTPSPIKSYLTAFSLPTRTTRAE